MSVFIEDNAVVSMHYILRDDDGTVLDRSEEDKPLRYLHGAGNILPRLEQAMLGKVEGDTLKVRVEPADAYGEVNPEGIKIIERAAFEGIESLEAGMTFEAKAPDGATQRILVKKVDGDEVTIDTNHPLAGIALNFDIEIVNVRQSTEEERTHGHAH